MITSDLSVTEHNTLGLALLGASIHIEGDLLPGILSGNVQHLLLLLLLLLLDLYCVVEESCVVELSFQTTIKDKPLSLSIKDPHPVCP